MSVDMFLKIDGIQGESTDDRHADEIDIFSYTWASHSRRLRAAPARVVPRAEW